MSTQNRWDWNLHPILLLVLILWGFAGLVALFQMVHPVTWQTIGYEVWHMPDGMGALLGSFFGLFGVAVSALIGFRTLKNGQEHAAELARKQQTERAEASSRAVASALYGELKAVRQISESYERRLKGAQASFDDRAKEDPTRLVDVHIIHQTIETPVFTAYVARLGELQPEIAMCISFIYNTLSDLVSMEGYKWSDQIEARIFAKLANVSRVKAALIVREIDRVTGMLQSKGMLSSI